MLPWDGMLKTALAMGIGPEVFWRLSLREWRWLGRSVSGAPSRMELSEMMAACPDGPTQEGERDDGV